MSIIKTRTREKLSEKKWKGASFEIGRGQPGRGKHLRIFLGKKIHFFLYFFLAGGGTFEMGDPTFYLDEIILIYLIRHTKWNLRDCQHDNQFETVLAHRAEAYSPKGGQKNTLPRNFFFKQ